MGLRGPKPKYENAQDFQKAVEAYCDKCEAEGKFPDEAGMLLYLGLKKRTIVQYTSEGNPNKKKYEDALEYAQLRRESWLTRTMVEEPKQANGCMNALKQKKNGGYVDRPMNEGGETKLTINLVGLGGESCFKG